jgi:peptidoglycan/xylan/chitin deacetylase (PgdA/CDA1 family)
MNIAIVQHHFDLVHLDDWIERASKGEPLPRLACALTFDDGWRDNYEFAFPVLMRAKAPAMIYLVSDMIGANYSFWPTRLSKLICSAWLRNDQRELTELATRLVGVSIPKTVPPGAERAVADRVVVEAKAHFTDSEMAHHLSPFAGKDITDTCADLLCMEEILAMKVSGLVRYGSHTRSHARLTAGIDPANLKNEVCGSGDDLESRLNLPVSGFCYPNGDHCAAALEAVRGRYSYAVSTINGWNSPATDKWLMRRVGLHDDVASSRQRFLARVAMSMWNP